MLVSDPSVGKMNKVRWVFEYYCLKRKRKRLLRDLAFLLVGEQAQKLDMDEDLRIVPLSYVLNPQVLADYIKQEEEKDLIESEKMVQTEEDYEAMLKRFEDSGMVLDDIELLGEEQDGGRGTKTPTGD